MWICLNSEENLNLGTGLAIAQTSMTEKLWLEKYHFLFHSFMPPIFFLVLMVNNFQSLETTSLFCEFSSLNNFYRIQYYNRLPQKLSRENNFGKNDYFIALIKCPNSFHVRRIQVFQADVHSKNYSLGFSTVGAQYNMNNIMTIFCFCSLNTHMAKKKKKEEITWVNTANRKLRE